MKLKIITAYIFGCLTPILFYILVVSKLNVYVETNEPYRSHFNMSEEDFYGTTSEIEVSFRVSSPVITDSFPRSSNEEVIMSLDTLSRDQRKILQELFNIHETSEIEFKWHDGSNMDSSTFTCSEGKATKPTSRTFLISEEISDNYQNQKID